MKQKSLNIEVRGIGFPNKGAELMLAALCEQIYQRFPFAKIAVPPVHQYRERAPYGVFQLGKVQKFGLDLGKLLYLMPAKMRNMFGIVMPSEIDVIIDASGFAYGDQWGAEKAANRLGNNIANFKSAKSHRKVIMLPQALGKFDSQALKVQMREIFRHADLVCAREAQSLEYAKQVSDLDTIVQFPDFTNLFTPSYQGKEDVSEHKVCIIPNAKMLQMKEGQDSSIYTSFMAGLLKQAHLSGLNPYVLVHEGVGDARLARDIVTASGIEARILQPATASDVKALIGKAELVISSRFHGLVSALSQGVPVIATGWSHKYKMLLQDYNMDEYLFDEAEGCEKACKLIEELAGNRDFFDNLCQQIKECSVTQKARTEEMWKATFAVLDDAVNG